MAAPCGAFNAKQVVSDCVNAVLEDTAASLEAYHDFFRQHLPPAEVSAETLAQGLDNTAARVAPHADACLSRFESWALEHIFARPRSLGSAEAEAARAEEDAAAAFTPQEEMQLDARMHAARCRLAAAHAALAATRAESCSLDAELSGCDSASRQLASLSEGAGKENAMECAVKLVVALTDFVPLLDTAEALAAGGQGSGVPLLVDAATAEADGARRRAAMHAPSVGDLAAFNSRLHG